MSGRLHSSWTKPLIGLMCPEPDGAITNTFFFCCFDILWILYFSNKKIKQYEIEIDNNKGRLFGH